MEIETDNIVPQSTVPTTVRWEIVHLRRDGNTYPQISKMVQRPISTCRDIYERWLVTGNVEDSKRSGRPPKISLAEKERLIETVRGHEDMSINELIEESKVNMSKGTAWTTMKQYGFKCKTQSVKWNLEPYHKEERLRWAKEHINKSDEFWQRVIFTDETKAQFKGTKQKLWVLGDEKPSPVERDRWQASVLLWGAISYDGNCILEVIDGTLDSATYLNILKRRLLKNYRYLRSDLAESEDCNPLLFQHDGAKPHGASDVKDYFRSRNIIILPWPPKSPDLNLIEGVWAWLKNQMKMSYQSLEEQEDVINIWEKLPFELVNNLYGSMKARIQAVIEAEGGPTEY